MNEKLMTVGGAAKKLGVSVRTLQYYDRIGLIAPTAQSEGGRRLYSYKDIVKVNQVLSMKYLGFSLDEIKDKLFRLDSPEEVLKALEAQEREVEKRLDALSEVRDALGLLKSEIEAMNTVDWVKYAGIIELLRNHNGDYWVVKHFDNKTLRRISEKFDLRAAEEFNIRLRDMIDMYLTLIAEGEPTDGAKAQKAAKDWWDMVTGFTGGDPEILRDIMSFAGSIDDWKDEDFKEKFAGMQDYLSRSLSVYFERSAVIGTEE